MKKSHNFIFYIFIWITGIVFTIFRGQFIQIFDSETVLPDLIVILTIYSFLFYGLKVAVIFTFTQGFLLDLFSVAPNGLFTLTYLVGFAVASILFMVVDPRHPKGQIFITLIYMVSGHCVYLGCMLLFANYSFVNISILISLMLHAIITAFFSPAIFFLINISRVSILGEKQESLTQRLYGMDYLPGLNFYKFMGDYNEEEKWATSIEKGHKNLL